MLLCCSFLIDCNQRQIYRNRKENYKLRSFQFVYYKLIILRSSVELYVKQEPRWADNYKNHICFTSEDLQLNFNRNPFFRQIWRVNMRTDCQERTSILCVNLLRICYDFFNKEFHIMRSIIAHITTVPTQWNCCAIAALNCFVCSDRQRLCTVFPCGRSTASTASHQAVCGLLPSSFCNEHVGLIGKYVVCMTFVNTVWRPQDNVRKGKTSQFQSQTETLLILNVISYRLSCL